MMTHKVKLKRHCEEGMTEAICISENINADCFARNDAKRFSPTQFSNLIC